MKNNNDISKQKRKYSAPEITEIKIDKEISLVMMSGANPGGDPPDGALPNNFNLNPFKMFKL